MDGRGRCLDNVFIERLWRSLKYEAVYLRDLKDGFETQRVMGPLKSRWRSGGRRAGTAASCKHDGQVAGQYGAGTYPHIHRRVPPNTATCLREGGVG